MTRQQWACLVGHKLQNEHVMDWRDLVRYEPLKNRTSDVEAANLDEAIQLFRSGLRRARHGHVDQAVPLIACAYLLDSRAIEFVPFLPHNDHEGAAYYFMDMVLLQRLVDFDRGHNFGSQVLMIYSAIRFGHLNRSTNGRMRIMQALVLSDRLIKAVFDDKSIETPERGVLGGCMKRTTLHRMRCSLYIALQNTSKAIQELSMALRIDPSLASIRCARACLYASLNDRDTIMAAQEFRQFIADCHPDSTELPLAYAWLAKLLMDNSKLGTYSQAKDYWKKSRRAAHRYMKLYGEESGSQIEKEMFDCFSSIEPTATFESSESEEETTGDELDNEQPCMGCARKDNKEGGNIFQCSRCKQVHYCSTDWQQQHWPDHSLFCLEKNPNSWEDVKAMDARNSVEDQKAEETLSSAQARHQDNRKRGTGKIHRVNRTPPRPMWPRHNVQQCEIVDMNRASSECRRQQSETGRASIYHGSGGGDLPNNTTDVIYGRREVDSPHHSVGFEERRNTRRKQQPGSGALHRGGSRYLSPTDNQCGIRDAVDESLGYYLSHYSKSTRLHNYNGADNGNSTRTARASSPPQRAASPSTASFDCRDEFSQRAEGFELPPQNTSSYEDTARTIGRQDTVIDERRSENCTASHSQHEKRMDANASLASLVSPERAFPYRQPRIETKVGLTHRRTPRNPLKNYEGQELANRRIRDYLIVRCEDHGSLFSKWWYQLPTKQRTEILNTITNGTVPMTAASLGMVSNMLQAGDPKFGARVLTDFSLGAILGPCDCENDACAMHDYRDQLLHDLHHYIMCWDIAESVDYQFCVSMVEKGVFPLRRNDHLKFMELPAQDSRHSTHRVLQMASPTPPAALASIHAMVRNGYLKEQVPFSYFLLRDSYRLAIYALLFEHFDRVSLGVSTSMPLSRLQGCEGCLQSCVEEMAVMCDMCNSKWWCCVDCRDASEHGRRCPVGHSFSMSVRFG